VGNSTLKRKGDRRQIKAVLGRWYCAIEATAVKTQDVSLAQPHWGKCLGSLRSSLMIDVVSATDPKRKRQ
jgi:hypothetical protein